MIDVKVDRNDPARLHDQVAAQIRRAIADGEAKPGERLPPARHLAAVMHVNTNTVLRALRMLRDEGLLELRRGHGIRVSGTPQRGALLTKAVELVQLSRESGYSRTELIRIIEQIPVSGLEAFSSLQRIGRDVHGTTRLAWTAELAQADAWFATQAQEAGLTVRRDPAGNLWAVPDAPPPWWGVGSHLDSVRRGGSYDGGLGVAAAFAVARRSPSPLAVLSFADEEGARFNTPTFGSRALAGSLDVAAVLQRVDEAGVTLREALTDAGVDPDGVAAAPQWLGRLHGFLELHIDQSTDVAQAGRAVGVVETIAARRRVRAEIRGASDHAGTTPPARRHDALSAAARLIVASEQLTDRLCGDDDPTLRSSANRIVVEPNAPSAIAARATVLLDARAGGDAVLDSWVASLRATAAELASLQSVQIELRLDAASPAARFPVRVVDALLRASPPGAPRLICFAGHDAAILAQRIPAGMVLVRNPTGISHAREEEVSLDDAAVGVETLLGALRPLG